MDYSNYNRCNDIDGGITAEKYLEVYEHQIIQDSERLFVSDFLYPLLGPDNIKLVVPQYPFIDSSGRSRRIDFGIVYKGKKVALEVNGETYHGENIIPKEAFDDNLDRQNEILNAGWYLLRFSYNQMKDANWRQKVFDKLSTLFKKVLSELVQSANIQPNPLQRRAIESLDFWREQEKKKGVIILPTGTGKTYLSAIDSTKVSGKILFIVHKLDILKQSREAFEAIYPNETLGLLTGEEKIEVHNSRILFASKDSLYNQDTLHSFHPNEFDYMMVDKVHHGQAPTYQRVLRYFEPNFFMLGLTATPDRTDRKDILELFDYQKIFECSLNEAIEDGYLVPYSYYGLTDNIDYSHIRYNGKKYNVEDLDRYLIIPERNQQILNEYLEKGEGNKALGFCCSIKHANAMAKFFNANGVSAIAITSQTENRDQLIQDFRDNKFNVAFTVDLFNEGIDFPNLRVLLFLRPTESKTIFVQQLGRGLRLANGKEQVIVLDFIGNYKRANNIRKFLAKVTEIKKDPTTGRFLKVEYQYSPKCDVHFTSEVEEILDNEDKQNQEVTKADLVGAYYDVKEQLKRRPSQNDINQYGEYKIAQYMRLYGTWTQFLKEIGELTESSYHFPQGTHLGHICYILKTIGDNKIANSHVASRYVKFDGNFDVGIDKFQRQTKYKLQACMEAGIIEDYRKNPDNLLLRLTPIGKQLYDELNPFLSQTDMSFNESGKTDIGWTMNCANDINGKLYNYMKNHNQARYIFNKSIGNIDAITLLLKYLS